MLVRTWRRAKQGGPSVCAAVVRGAHTGTGTHCSFKRLGHPHLSGGGLGSYPTGCTRWAAGSRPVSRKVEGSSAAQYTTHNRGSANESHAERR